jgi:hypothetical protein
MMARAKTINTLSTQRFEGLSVNNADDLRFSKTINTLGLGILLALQPRPSKLLHSDGVTSEEKVVSRFWWKSGRTRLPITDRTRQL